jgi:hypothetical protein
MRWVGKVKENRIQLQIPMGYELRQLNGLLFAKFLQLYE